MVTIGLELTAVGSAGGALTAGAIGAAAAAALDWSCSFTAASIIALSCSGDMTICGAAAGACTAGSGAPSTLPPCAATWLTFEFGCQPGGAWGGSVGKLWAVAMLAPASSTAPQSACQLSFRKNCPNIGRILSSNSPVRRTRGPDAKLPASISDNSTHFPRFPACAEIPYLLVILANRRAVAILSSPLLPLTSVSMER